MFKPGSRNWRVEPRRKSLSPIGLKKTQACKQFACRGFLKAKRAKIFRRIPRSNFGIRVKPILTSGAPKPIGPYSQALQVDRWLFISGQIPLDPLKGTLISGSIEEETRRVLKNIKAIVESAGGDLSHIVKTTIFLKNLQNFEEVNQVYSEYFGQTKPARSTVQVSGLPKGANIEIEAIAILD